MSSAIFACPWTATVTNTGGNADLWEFNPGDDRPIRIRGIRLGQTSEVADAEEEGLRITVRRFRATVTSSNGTSGTAEDVGRANQSPTFTWEYNGATVATTTGDNELIEEISWNVRNSPFEIWYPDERFAPACVQTEALLVRLEDTVTDDITFAGTVWIEELG